MGFMQTVIYVFLSILVKISKLEVTKTVHDVSERNPIFSPPQVRTPAVIAPTTT